MERIVAIIIMLILAVSIYSMYWQANNCTTDFTTHGHPITICEPMEYIHR